MLTIKDSYLITNFLLHGDVFQHHVNVNGVYWCRKQLLHFKLDMFNAIWGKNVRILNTASKELKPQDLTNMA